MKSTGTVAASSRESLRRQNWETLLHNLSTNRYQSNDSDLLSGSLPSSENIVRDTIGAYGTVRIGQGQRVLLTVKSLYQRVSELWGECFWMKRWHSLEHVLDQNWSDTFICLLSVGLFLYRIEYILLMLYFRLYERFKVFWWRYKTNINRNVVY